MKLRRAVLAVLLLVFLVAGAGQAIAGPADGTEPINRKYGVCVWVKALDVGVCY